MVLLLDCTVWVAGANACSFSWLAFTLRNSMLANMAAQQLDNHPQFSASSALNRQRSSMQHSAHQQQQILSRQLSRMQP